MEAAERLRVTKTSLEVNNEKLEAELEETKQRLRAALSKPVTEGADTKTWKASVVTRSANCSLCRPFESNSKAFTALTKSKQWRAACETAAVCLPLCRMFENKMKELEKELSQKTSRLSEVKQQLKEANEREERAQSSIRQLEDQVHAKLQGRSETAYLCQG